MAQLEFNKAGKETITIGIIEVVGSDEEVVVGVVVEDIKKNSFYVPFYMPIKKNPSVLWIFVYVYLNLIKRLNLAPRWVYETADITAVR